MNSENKPSGRREFLRSAGVVGATLATVVSAPKLWAEGVACLNDQTPIQPKGPFYPVQDQLDKDNDLTHVEGQNMSAKGQILYIRGQVTDQNCLPVAGALVEIWQACESGRYNHPGDQNNSAPLDEHFQYWGQFVTREDGHYIFKTIRPGSYPAGEDWIRPPHVHFKLMKRGFSDLITQMYFSGDELNAKDLILQQLSQLDQKRVVIELQSPSSDFEPESKIAEFNIVMQQMNSKLKS